ncbi:MAG: helix-turn-helix domain-containing protein [Defluviitaleaceae bacterium]|nr:helix-turn-helix domain-containing protein [Defluviitaleaceae bacterium]
MIGERLKEVRTKKGITQKELSTILCVQESAISQYETNRSDPSDKIKVGIAKHFGVSLDYFMGVIDDEVPYYCTEKFLFLPKNIVIDDIVLMRQFLDFLKFRRTDINNSIL